METTHNTRKILVNILAVSLMICTPLISSAQNQNAGKSYEEIEKTQDEIESLYVNIYGIMDIYPKATYTYEYDNGMAKEVLITGVPKLSDKEQLELYLMSLEDLKRDIYNLSNRTGVYYVSESEPEPKMGYRDFYDKLHNELSYPEKVKDRGVEGTVYVKFVVDSDGEVSNAILSDDIDADDYLVKALQKEAKEAVLATSGYWKPAKVGGINVASWAMVPVQFKLESPYFRPIFF